MGGSMGRRKPKRWQDDSVFLAALKARGYVSPDGALYMTAGAYLYMWELWLDGVKHGAA